MSRFFKDLKKYGRYAIYSSKSALKTEVANSYLNWIWWILEPLCLMLIYVFVFGRMFKHKQEYYNVFVFTAQAGWDFFSRSIRASVSIVKSNKSIVSKVYLPKYMLVMSNMMENAFKMFVCFGIVIVMMIFYKVPFTLHMLEAIPVLLGLFLFTFGCATTLLHFGVFVEDFSKIINILLRFLFYLTGIFYSIEGNMPSPYSDILMTFNPMAVYLQGLRNCLIYGKHPNYVTLCVWTFIALLLSIFGVIIIYRHENTYVKVI